MRPASLSQHRYKQLYQHDKLPAGLLALSVPTATGHITETAIPVSYLNSLGLFYADAFSNVNIMAFLCGGTAGTSLDLDAAFFYKPAV